MGNDGSFSLRHRFQTGSGSHPASYPMGGLFPWRVKQQGREADHSPPYSSEVKNEWIYTYYHSPNTPSWRGVQLKKSTGTTLPLILPRIFSCGFGSSHFCCFCSCFVIPYSCLLPLANYFVWFQICAATTNGHRYCKVHTIYSTYMHTCLALFFLILLAISAY
jgi:hypothetical protein